MTFFDSYKPLLTKNVFSKVQKITKIAIPTQDSVHIVDGVKEVTDPNAEFALLIKFFGLDPSLIELELNESKGFYCLGTWDYNFIDYLYFKSKLLLRLVPLEISS